VALLRAINLGATNKVPMAELRELMAELGYEDVKTLLQSGNAVFAVDGRKAAELEDELSAALEARYGFAVPVMVRSASELAAVVEANPFVDDDVEVKQLHATFLSADPTASNRRSLDPDDHAPDEFAFGDRVMYVRLPNGVQGSRVLGRAEKALGVRTTTRTWNTVTKLLALVAD
jgi:uncharacterized protein (DUF1697 family)